MTTPITPDECRELAKRLGIEWHHIDLPTISNPWLTCICGATFSYLDEAIRHQNKNPDFTDAREVLKVMKEREDWFDFAVYLRARGKATIISCATTSGVDRLHIDITLMTDETGLLRDETIKFLEGR